MKGSLWSARLKEQHHREESSVEEDARLELKSLEKAKKDLEMERNH